MTKPKMPLIQGNFFTNEGGKKPGRGSRKGWPWIEAELIRALKEQLTCLEILNTEKVKMKFNKNMVISCELINRDTFFLYLRNIKERINESYMRE